MEDLGTKILFAVGLTLLTLLLTGPGMWSERWGWGWVKKKGKGSGPGDERRPEKVRRSP